MSRPQTKRTGRRPGGSDTRERIAVAARSLFADLGYERTTFRGIAAAAGVDPALVVHFYGSKDELFRQVMVLPPAMADALEQLAAGPRRAWVGVSPSSSSAPSRTRPHGWWCWDESAPRPRIRMLPPSSARPSPATSCGWRPR